MEQVNKGIFLDVALNDDAGNFRWIRASIEGLNAYAKAVPQGLRFSLDPDGTLVGMFFGQEQRDDWPLAI